MSALSTQALAVIVDPVCSKSEQKWGAAIDLGRPELGTTQFFPAETQNSRNGIIM
jgi:hypothetical protein